MTPSDEPIACLDRRDGRTTWVWTNLEAARRWRVHLRGEGTPVSRIVARQVSVLGCAHVVHCIVVGAIRAE